MDLRSYLDLLKIPPSQFAADIDVTTPALARYMAGERIPRPDVLERICLVTRGLVQPNDFYAFTCPTAHRPRQRRVTEPA